MLSALFTGCVDPGGVISDRARCDGKELIECQDAGFAASVAFPAFVEDRNTSFQSVSGKIS
jgi:hypothetical protein